MKRAFFCAFILATLALGLAAGDATAQPCPPGFHMQPGAGCVRNAPAPIPPAELRMVVARRLNVRPRPTPQTPPVAVLTRGTPVRILGFEGAWVRIRVPQTSIEGWVLRQYIN